MASSGESVDLGRGARLSIAGADLQLSVARLFADRRITLPAQVLAVCDPSEITDDTPDEIDATQPPPAIAFMTSRRHAANLLFVLAEPLTVPPVRLFARLSARGMIYQSARHRPVDGFLFSAPDPEQAIATLVRHGVERTTTPRTWIWARRRPPDAPATPS
jgi:hypothetical protein